MVDRPRALILGLTGQDGSYLAEHLLGEGVEVHGTCRPGEEAHPERLWRLEGCVDRLHLHPVELTDLPGLRTLIQDLQPRETYHLAGTRQGFDEQGDPAAQVEGAIATTHTLLEALTQVPEAGLLLAASSEMYGPCPPAPQNEDTPLRPASFYGIAKAAGLSLARVYRERHGLRACAAILFNHESPRRGEGYVTRRITRAAARIALGLQQELHLGDVSARRDWGHARSFARGMALMLRQEKPEDLVLATGRTHSVAEFAEQAFRHVGLKAMDHLRVDASLVRPAGGALVGDPRRAEALLGWRDEVPFEALVTEMVDADLARERRLAP